MGSVSACKLRDSENPEFWAEKQKDSLKTLLEYMESVKAKNKNTRFKHVRFSFMLLEEYANEKGVVGEREGCSFYEMFEKMRF